jgi:hypothetical protein
MATGTTPNGGETGIVWYTSDLHDFPSHPEDRSGISTCSRSARTQPPPKGGRIDLDLSKDRLAISRIDLNLKIFDRTDIKSVGRLGLGGWTGQLLVWSGFEPTDYILWLL